MFNFYRDSLRKQLHRDMNGAITPIIGRRYSVGLFADDVDFKHKAKMPGENFLTLPINGQEKMK